MKCSVHNSFDAVGTCLSCNKGLCVDCVDHYKSPSCRNCAQTLNARLKREFVAKISLTVLCLLIFGLILPVRFYLNGALPHRQALAELMFLYASYVFFPYGARVVSEKAPVFFNILLDLIFFPFYFMLSLFLGLLVGPFKLFSMLKELKVIKLTNRLDAEFFETEEEQPDFLDVQQRVVNSGIMH